MTPEEFAKKMDSFKDKSRETRHIEGDALMVEVLKELGYSKGVDIFIDWEKWWA